MIEERTIGGHKILFYSVSQAAARISRHPGSVRQMERKGVIPSPFTRSEKQYRLYSMHELNALEHCFKSYNIKQGTEIPESFKIRLKDLFAAISKAYQSKTFSIEQLPKEARNA